MMLALAVLSGAWPATGAERARLTPDAAYREVQRSGSLQHADIAGDLDVSRLVPPVGADSIAMRDVRVEGRVYASADGPPVALLLEDATLQRLDFSGARLRAGFTLDRSTVRGPARFDDSVFEAPFVLHAGTFAGGAVFRRARFKAPVEIVAMQFETPPGMRGGVSFADTAFAAPARFDRSTFSSGVRFDTSRFEADATFLGLVAAGPASWRNVMFSRDAEFRFCRLSDVDFGDDQQMSVFGGLADFRGCTMRSARLDYVDARGDVMLVNVTIEPGDLTLRHAALRGGRTDLTGLRVAGRLDLRHAHISALHFRWSELAGPLARAGADSDVLGRLQRRLEALGQRDEALLASAAVANQRLRERLAGPLSTPERLRLRLEWLVWGLPTAYGTELGRIAVVTVAAWLLLSLPILASMWGPGRLGTWRGPLSEAPPRHRPVPPEALEPGHGAPLDRGIQLLSYSFGLMFATPGLRLRPAAPLSTLLQLLLTAMRGIGALLLALLALTLANVSPVFQAILGKVAW